MNTKRMAMIFGIVFLAIGILGFVPGMVQPPAADDPDVAFDAGHGRLMGLFPVNVLHNIVHILFGLWGLAAARSFDGARGYFKVVAVAYALLAVMGLLPPPASTTFGLVPIHHHDVWLHAALALVAAYFGFRRADAGATAAARA